MAMLHLERLLVLISALLALGASSARADLLTQLQSTHLLRVCADPDNLPFSSRDVNEPGYDVELAGEIAAGLGARVDMTWVPTFLGRSAVRQLFEGKCDLFMGLPHDERFLDSYPRLLLSRPYYTLRQLLVSPAAQPVHDLRGLQDRKVAVEGMSLGDIFLFQHRQPRELYRTQPEAFQAVVRGEAAAALLWAPIGWWLVKKQPGAQVQGIEIATANLEFKVAAGLRKGEEALQQAINTVIEQLVTLGKVASILARYGQPTTAMGQTTTSFPTVTQVASNPQQGSALYYQICALCHGQSADGGGPIPNLKEFQGGEERFLKITLAGRPDRGMPPWKGKLSEEEVQAIFAFIQSLPK